MGEGKLKKQHLWLIIAGLLLVNCFTVIFFSIKSSSGDNEAVAVVGKAEISRQEWINEMEVRYGKEVLDELVNQKVIEAAGKKYKINITDEEIDREMKLLKTVYGLAQNDPSGTAESIRREIKNGLILEELLTKDAEIPEDELISYYEENKEQYTFPDSYHFSQIVLETKEEAEQALKELVDGSSFSVLAMERSIDTYTAGQGGDTGFVSEETEHFDQAILHAAKQLKPGERSGVFAIEDGYAIIELHEHLEGDSFAFQDVKAQIRRQIALEQMETPVSAHPFWDDVRVEWFYNGSE